MVNDSSKSLLIAYVLWLFGGFLGLHHFYLHRSRQCFLYLITLGGYFGLGSFRDLWRLPEYVRDFNMDKEYEIYLKKKMKSQLRPSTGVVREGCKISMGNIFGYLIVCCIPKDYLGLTEFHLRLLNALLAPLASAIGVHTVGNIGRHRGSLKDAIIGAYIPSPLLFSLGLHQVFWSSLVSRYMFNRNLAWRSGPLRSNRNCLVRLVTILFCLVIFSTLTASFFYFNCEFTDEFGQPVPCKEAVRNFINSPVISDLSSTLHDLHNYYKAYGFAGFWKEIVEMMDLDGEGTALQVLNLTDSANEKEIRATYHKLSRQWHPDRYKDPIEQSEAQEIYIKIQKAYETLSRTKIRRLKKNLRPVEPMQ